LWLTEEEKKGRFRTKMIFPENYRFVGVKEGKRPEDPIYFSTRYLINLEGPELYLVESSGEGFMRSLEKLELIASGREIVVLPEILDTRNRASLISTAYEICKDGVNTVVFKGPDEHITFVHEPDLSQILTVEVLDAAPPDPPWLCHVIKNLESCGILGDLQVQFRYKTLDLRDFDSEDAYYPCRASGLGRSLDCDKVVHDMPKIVGCDVSKEIFKENYPGKEFEFINICPSQSLVPEGPFISRCCRSERRGLTKRDGHIGVLVHWGDGPYEISEAIRCLVKAARE
jgi:hypothetical protein